ncbi:MAG: purine-nucleoside phosphorylase [Candidatus Kapabacteria bacterium]|nr:purine-nucleoside phosphorylase [Candidatus Kapabacteria bacterium]
MAENKSTLAQQIKDTISAIRQHTQSEPKIGIILGTGLGGLAAEIIKEIVLPYSNLPHFPLSTVESHHGNLIFGSLGGKQVVAMQGRFHYYEGYTMKQITYPVRVMKRLGVDILLVSNACGSLNPYFKKCNIMIMDDHINLFGDNPLIGPNEDDFGPRFSDMSQPYSHRLTAMAERIAIENKILTYKGVYAAMSGPSLETRAEYRFLRTIGADVIGMSTIPECIVARHSGMEVLGFSIITDECYPDCLHPVGLDEILEAAGKTEPNLTMLMKKIVESL